MKVEIALKGFLMNVDRWIVILMQYRNIAWHITIAFMWRIENMYEDTFIDKQSAKSLMFALISVAMTNISPVTNHTTS